MPASHLAGLGIPKITKSGRRPSYAGTQHPEERVKSATFPSKRPNTLPPSHPPTHGPYLPGSELLQSFFPGDWVLPSGPPPSDLRFICSRERPGHQQPQPVGGSDPTGSLPQAPRGHAPPPIKSSSCRICKVAKPRSRLRSGKPARRAPRSPGPSSLPWTGSAGGAPRLRSAPHSRSSARPPCSRNNRPRPPRRCSRSPPPTRRCLAGNWFGRRAQDCVPALRGCGQRRLLPAVLPLRRHPAKGKRGCAPPRPPCRRAESLGRRRESPGGASRSRADGSAPGSGR